MREAADVLGISVEAVRGRIKRGTLGHDKEANGAVYVWLEDEPRRDQTSTGSQPDADRARPDARDELVSEMGERIEDLRRQLDQAEEARRRADTIIMQLTQTNAALAARLPELKAPPAQERPQETESGAEASEGAEPRSDTVGPQTGVQEPKEAPRRSWWVRWFGG